MRNRLSFRGANNDLNENILLDLQRVRHLHNSYINSFKQAIGIIKEYSTPGKCSTGDINLSNDKRLIPAVIMVGDDTNDPNIKPVDVVVQYRESNKKLDYISQIHRSYDPLRYVFLFPYGEDGRNVLLKDNYRSKNITECDFYSYRLQV
ncbi:Hypothetical predicted protein [Octopus vulgaris]|uniref:Uncharacterized protein n=1 Tax=Octopus vulgaris TaxID=6645 RepID=A0AA36B3Z8_OCTVU|nr:Hypothetical predicted protein [Octopus vulgaris]